MKDRIYKLATMWLTLSVIFFIAEYLTGWLEVVTLGGLVAGSFIEGFFTVLGLKLMGVVTGREFYGAGVAAALGQRAELLKALVITAAFAWEGALTLCRVLPGYTMHSNAAHLIFLLLLYPFTAIILELISRQKEIE